MDSSQIFEDIFFCRTVVFYQNVKHLNADGL